MRIQQGTEKVSSFTHSVNKRPSCSYHGPGSVVWPAVGESDMGTSLVDLAVWGRTVRPHRAVTERLLCVRHCSKHQETDVGTDTVLGLRAPVLLYTV